MDISHTKALLVRYRELNFEHTVLKQNSNSQQERETQERLDIIEKQLQMLEQCLSVLNTDETFVIKNHLLSGLKWSDVLIMYENQFGTENAKAERTLKQIQSKALKKISYLITKTDTERFFQKLL